MVAAALVGIALLLLLDLHLPDVDVCGDDEPSEERHPNRVGPDDREDDEEDGADEQPGSELLAERAEADDLGPAWGSKGNGVMLTYVVTGLIAAMDHLRSLRLLLAPDPTVFGAQFASRVVAEGCCRVWWLVEPGVGMRERVERGLMMRLEDLRANERVLRDLGAPEEKVVEAQDRLAMVLGDIHDIGIDVHLKDGVPSGMTRSVPGSAEMMGDVLSEWDFAGGAGIYAFQSGVLHSRFYALRQYITDLQPGIRPDEQQFQLGISYEQLWSASYIALTSFMSLWDRVVPAFGFNHDEWTEWRLHIIKTLVKAKTP